MEIKLTFEELQEAARSYVGRKKGVVGCNLLELQLFSVFNPTRGCSDFVITMNSKELPADYEPMKPPTLGDVTGAIDADDIFQAFASLVPTTYGPTPMRTSGSPYVYLWFNNQMYTVSPRGHAVEPTVERPVIEDRGLFYMEDVTKNERYTILQQYRVGADQYVSSAIASDNIDKLKGAFREYAELKIQYDTWRAKQGHE